MKCAVKYSTVFFHTTKCSSSAQEVLWRFGCVMLVVAIVASSRGEVKATEVWLAHLF